MKNTVKRIHPGFAAVSVPQTETQTRSTHWPLIVAIPIQITPDVGLNISLRQ